MRAVCALLLAVVAALVSGCSVPVRPHAPAPVRTRWFLGLTDFAPFMRLGGPSPGQEVWVSPELAAPFDWNELVVSWNASPATALKVEARALGGDWASPFYNLGLWSLEPARHPRHSVNGQKDPFGEVKTDTLALRRLARRAQVRLTLRRLDGGAGPAWKAPSDAALQGSDLGLKFLGLSFLNNTVPPATHPPNRAAWGCTLPVPEKAQNDYPGGRDWCSPTCVAMVLGYWAAALGRPELAVEVPEAARAIHDPSWGGTGNWVFNTAFAGSFEGLRACVSRWDDLSEVEDWIAAGLPVVLSVSFDLLTGNPRDQGPGHLIVCAGFTAEGDVVVNDPWAPKARGLSVRRVYPRRNVAVSWGRSRHTVYLIYPESAKLPGNRLGHW